MKLNRVYIEITNICNLNCSFCPKNSRLPMVMDVSFFKDIAKQVKEITDHIYLHVMGEPLLHPKLDEILRICEQNHLQVNLTTNATKLKDKIDILKNTKSLRKVTLSIQSYEANGGKDWEGYLEDCIECVNQLSKDVIIEYRLWNFDNNQFAQKEVEFLLKKYNTQAIYPTELTNNKYDKSIELKNNTYIMFGENFVWPIQGKQQKEKGYCPALRKQLAILVDGTVVPCCLDSEGRIELGNLHKDCLSSILKSEKAEELLKGFSSRKRIFDLCKQCEFIDRF